MIIKIQKTYEINYLLFCFLRWVTYDWSSLHFTSEYDLSIDITSQIKCNSKKKIIGRIELLRELSINNIFISIFNTIK